MSLSRQETLAWLEKVPLLRQCGAEVLEHIADASGELPFADGDAIVLQGQVGNGLYIVTSGEVRIVAGGEELARLGPGELIPGRTAHLAPGFRRLRVLRHPGG